MDKKIPLGIKVMGTFSLVMCLFGLVLDPAGRLVGSGTNPFALLTYLMLFLSSENIFRQKNWARIMIIGSSLVLLIHYSMRIYWITRYVLADTLFPEVTRRFIWQELLPISLFLLLPFILNISYFMRPRTRQYFK